MSPRLDRMSLREIEDAGQRWYERLGAMNGEDAEMCGECEMPYDPDDEVIADPDDNLQPWEVEPRDD